MKRLSAYSKIEIIEVPDEKAPENMSDKEIEQVKEKEGQRLLAKIKPQATVITLEIQGKMLSSEGLAEEMQRRMTQGQSDFVFVIGGSNGLHETSYNAATTHFHSVNDIPTSNDARCLNRASIQSI